MFLNDGRPNGYLHVRRLHLALVPTIEFSFADFKRSKHKDAIEYMN